MLSKQCNTTLQTKTPARSLVPCIFGASNMNRQSTHHPGQQQVDQTAELEPRRAPPQRADDARPDRMSPLHPVTPGAPPGPLPSQFRYLQPVQSQLSHQERRAGMTLPGGSPLRAGRWFMAQPLGWSGGATDASSGGPLGRPGALPVGAQAGEILIRYRRLARVLRYDTG